MSQWQAGKNWGPPGPACSRFYKELRDRSDWQCGQATMLERPGHVQITLEDFLGEAET